MSELKLSRDKLQNLLSSIDPVRAVGVSGLATLCSASLFALIPDTSTPALVSWIGGLGLNVLAGVLQQHFQRLKEQPTVEESERILKLSEGLAKDIRRQSELRREIGILLGDLDAFKISKEIVEGNPAIHGWFLVKIFDDVTQYRADFDRIHMTLAELKQMLRVPTGTEKRELSGQNRLRLVEKSNDSDGQSFESKERIISIGRSPDNDIILEGSTVSWYHGFIEQVVGQFSYHHVSQTNPTVIRRKRQEYLLTHKRQSRIILQNNDRIIIGRKIFLLDFDLKSGPSGYITTEPQNKDES